MMQEWHLPGKGEWQQKLCAITTTDSARSLNQPAKGTAQDGGEASSLNVLVNVAAEVPMVMT